MELTGKRDVVLMDMLDVWTLEVYTCSKVLVPSAGIGAVPRLPVRVSIVRILLKVETGRLVIVIVDVSILEVNTFWKVLTLDTPPGS